MINIKTVIILSTYVSLAFDFLDIINRKLVETNTLVQEMDKEYKEKIKNGKTLRML